MALSVATWEFKKLQYENDELTKQNQEIREAWRRTRQCELAGFEKLTQVERTLEMKDKEVEDHQRELSELRGKHDALVDEKESAGMASFKNQLDISFDAVATEEGSGRSFRMW